MADCDCHEIEGLTRNVLRWLLAINASLFVLEVGVGWWAQSLALAADGVDMLADALVYGLSLAAIGRSPQFQKRTARFSGVLQMTLAVLIWVGAWQRFQGGRLPAVWAMGGVGLLALIGNAIAVVLLAKHRQGAVHLQASWIFSRNDVLANLGTIGAGLLCGALQTNLPDLVVGAAIGLLVAHGSWKIWRLAR
ncbi:MAG: cation transporter [Oscillatoriales cyanobacterium SM2_1_8]|nr:cation transporter [Oscillatoriales cyanobacterium SM2_1_8]